jgi:hypothetical protein
MASKKEVGTVEIVKVDKLQLKVCVVGTSPIILNRMSEKVRQELLLPRGRKNAAEKQASLKHNPVEEFNSSPYRIGDEDAPTYLGIMASAFKGAMRTAALDLPGSSKSQIGRLVYVVGDLVPIYGRPYLHMSVTRSADISRTPDIRTRAIIPKWAAIIEINFVSPILKANTVLNLLAASGITSGVGDWRPEKGKGDYGQYRIATADDPEFLEIVKGGGRDIQIQAMEVAEPYDLESRELLEWFDVEAARRGFQIAQ